MLNQEISATFGAPFIGEGQFGFDRSGRGSLFRPLQNRSSYRGFSRNANGDFVIGVGAALGVGVNAEFNLTRANQRIKSLFRD
jgi:hypothetical protein